MARATFARRHRRRGGAAASLAVSTALCAALAGTLALPDAVAAPHPVTVASADGLGLTLSPGGRVSSVRLGRTQVAGADRPPLFAVRRVGGQPNLLPNPGLETDTDGQPGPDGWRLMSGPLPPTWVTDQAHTGDRSVRFQVPTTGTTTSLQTTVPVRPATFYTWGGWIRGEDVQPTAATAEPATGASPVRLKVQQLSGTTVVDSAQAFGYTDTADWHQKLVGFRTRSDVTAVRVIAQVVAGSGTVWFDDLSLEELFAPAWSAAQGTARPTSAGASYDGSAAGLDVHAELRGKGDHLRVDGVVSSPADEDVPFQLRLSIPLDAVGWRWWDDLRHARTVETGARYDYLTEWTEQQTSRYPFNTLTGPAGSLSVGLPLSEPRLARVEYADGRLDLTLDLGVSPVTQVVGTGRVPFSVVLFRSEPAWGYRAALAKYYDVFPGDFRRHTDVAHEGGWVGAVNRAKLEESWRDFGIGLDMIALGTGNDGGDSDWGRDFLTWTDERGIYATAYNHHWGYKHVNPDDPVIPSYDTEVARLTADAELDPVTPDEERRRDRAAASLRSGARDNNGRYQYAKYKTFLQHYENLNQMSGTDWREVSRTYQLEPALAMAEDVGGTLDAIHLDSVSGMRRWGAADDYDRTHWAHARYGLTFSYDSGRVVDRLALGVAGQVANVSRYAHRRELFLSANFNGSDARPGSWFGAQAIDYIGLERGLPEKASDENDPYTTVDGFALFKRALAAQRPISTIDPDCDTYSGADVDRRLQQTLLYGIYMGCGGPAPWTDEQRAVFATYTPLLRTVNRAGWEPVTRARPSDPTVLVERFGSVADDGAVWIAVHNPGDTARPYQLTVQAAALDGLGAADLEAVDQVSGTPLALSPAKGRVAFGGTLAPFGTTLARVRPAR